VLALLLIVATQPVAAQVTPSVVRVTGEGAPIAGAVVRAVRERSEDTRMATTDDAGNVSLALDAGRWLVTVEAPGWATDRAVLVVGAGGAARLEVALDAEAIEEEGIIVEATRGQRRIEDEPLRVEVIAREEIEEKMLMTPGSIAMLLNESTGLRVQETTPALGGATVRIQGLRGRYTRILSDGLPLYGEAGALGLLQIPPMDLRQVEVIKGAASAFYGADALGGVVNLVSRRPDGARELLANVNTRGGTDLVGWASAEEAGWTLVAGLHRQDRIDVDDDGWSDMPGHRRALARLRWFRENGAVRTMLTLGGMTESRRGGGTVTTGDEVSRRLGSKRVDIGSTVSTLIEESMLLGLRASAMVEHHDHRWDEQRERDLHSTVFLETTARQARGAHTLLGGLALRWDRYEAEDVIGFDRSDVITSMFLQDEIDPVPWLSLSASARLDRHPRFGSTLSPRGSALLRVSGPWTLRLSLGSGFATPTPFTEETEDVGLGRLLPLGDARPERARTASIDLGGRAGPVELTATLFGSDIRNALAVREDVAAARLRIVNLDGVTRTRGTELLVRMRREPFVLTASHTYVHANEPDPDGIARRAVPLTPRHQAGLVAMIEEHGVGRAGVEVYHIGRQPLEDDPYREDSRAHTIVGLLFERVLGRARVFLNLENLTDTRQTRYESLLRPTATPAGRWTTDVWAPLEGRLFNGGVRVTF
jgi:iron complex outermembrane receptor protein